MKNYSETTWTELNSKNRISPVCGINAVSTKQVAEYLGVTGKELSAMRAKLIGRLKTLGMFTESMKNLFGRIPGAEKLSGFEYVLPLEDGGTIRVSGGPVVYYPAGALALLADAVQERCAVNRAAAYNQAKENPAPVGAEMNLVVFSNPEFGDIRAVEIDGEPWFVGKDIAVALGYSNPRKTLCDHIDEEDKGVTKCDTLGGAQEMTIINESGLYSLILSSKLQDAKKFKRWVTSEVLPSIRKPSPKHGGCAAQQGQMSGYAPVVTSLPPAQNAGVTMQMFENPLFGKIRTITENSKTLFCGSDVAKALGYKNPTKALSDHCKGTVDRRTNDSLGRQQTMKFIPEGDIYRLAAQSELPRADAFERWIFDEVLPSIRKHGGYIAGQEQMSDDELMAKALMVAQNKIAERDRLISELKTKAEIDAPKVAFADAVHDARSDITVEKFAKLLCNKNGVNIGRNNMFFLLRNMGYLRENNMPYQKYLQAGYFTTRELLKNGRLLVQTMITGKGQMLLFDKVIDAVRSSM